MEKGAPVTFSANPRHYGPRKLEYGPKKKKKKKKKRETHVVLKVSKNTSAVDPNKHQTRR